MTDPIEKARAGLQRTTNALGSYRTGKDEGLKTMIRTIPMDEIVIPERQRKIIKEEGIQALAKSIHEKALFHPIVLRDHKTLVAGERRLRAIKLLKEQGMTFTCDGDIIPYGMAAYIELTDLSEIQYREAELEENILREDLTWQERVKAIDELHNIRKAQNPKQTFTQTAVEMGAETADGARQPSGFRRREVSQAQLVAAYLDDPDVAAAPDAKRAHNIASRKLQDSFAQQLIKYSSKSNHHFTHGKLEDVVWGENNFNCVIADPPYGIDIDQGRSTAILKHRYRDDKANAKYVGENIIVRSWKATADKAHMFIFCDIDLFDHLKYICAFAGWKPRRIPIVWYKGNVGHPTEGKTGFRRSYELILYASKGGAMLRTFQSDLIQHCSWHSSEIKDHPAQKPDTLYEYLLNLAVAPGDRVIDPCCGSGTIFRAAHKLSMAATGIEMDEGQAAHCQAELLRLGMETS
jgi:ParB-like chromosome segregation protein Spo0J